MTELNEIEPKNSHLRSGDYMNISRLTPHRISILVFIHQYFKTKHRWPIVATSIQAKRMFCLKFLKLVQSRDMTYLYLYSTLNSSDISDNSEYLNDFEKAMCDFGISVENLFDLFDVQASMDNFLSENSSFSQYGLLGLFIRRVIVAFECMSYFEIENLHRNIVLYYERGQRACITPQITQGAQISNRSNLMLENNFETNIWSTKQAELFVLHQTYLLQSDDRRAASPIEIKAKVDEILRGDPFSFKVLFLSFMNNLRIIDFFLSLEYLHQSFDNIQTKDFDQGKCSGFQYASFSLAMLHTEINQKMFAYACLQETITLSRLRMDNSCLKLAYAWKHLFHDRIIKPNENTIFGNAWVPQIIPPPLYLPFLVVVARLFAQKPGAVFTRLSEIDKLPRENLTKNLLNSVVERAAIWIICGKSGICSFYAQVSANMTKPLILQKASKADYYAHSLLSVLALGQGERETSFVILRHFRSTLRYPAIKLWLVCKSCISNSVFASGLKCQKSLEICNKVSLLNSKIGLLQLTSLLISRANLRNSQRKLNILGQTTSFETCINLPAFLLYSCTKILQPHLSSQLLTVLFATLANTKKRYVNYYVSAGNMMLSQILTSMRMAASSSNILDQCVQSINSHGNVYDISKWSIMFVESLLKTNEDPYLKIKRVQQCAEIINRAIINFRKLEAYSNIRDAAKCLAIFYNNVGLILLRNRYSYIYKLYDKSFQDRLQ